MILERLELVKDCDPFNKQLLNDCYNELLRLRDDLSRAHRQLEELGYGHTSHDNIENNKYEGF